MAALLFRSGRLMPSRTTSGLSPLHVGHRCLAQAELSHHLNVSAGLQGDAQPRPQEFAVLNDCQPHQVLPLRHPSQRPRRRWASPPHRLPLSSPTHVSQLSSASSGPTAVGIESCPRTGWRHLRPGSPCPGYRRMRRAGVSQHCDGKSHRCQYAQDLIRLHGHFKSGILLRLLNRSKGKDWPFSFTNLQ